MAVTPETRKNVLEDYHSKRVTKATELAKKYSLSRSSVYRILTADAHTRELEGARSSKEFTDAKGNSPIESETQRLFTTSNNPRNTIILRNSVEAKDDDKQSVISERSEGSDVTDGFFYRSDKFADDLGLPMTTVGVQNFIDEESPEQQRYNEVEMDAMMERITGNGGSKIGETSPPSALLDEVLNAPPPPPTRKRKLATDERRMEVPMPYPSEHREDTIQRIVFQVEHFYPVVKSIVGENKEHFLQQLSTRSHSKLLELLTMLERTRSIGNIASGFKQTFYVVGQATEVLTQMVGMRTQGFADHLKTQDDEITMIMKELALEQWRTIKDMDRPELRLGALFCLTLVQTDGQNRMKEHATQMLQSSRVQASTVESSSDL